MSELNDEIEEEFLGAEAQMNEALERWSESSAPAEGLANARRQYQRIHVAMLQTLSNASALLVRVEQLSLHLKHIEEQQELISAVENGTIHDPVEILDKFKEDRDRAVDEETTCKDRAEAAGMQVAALKIHRDALYVKLAELEDERRLELTPQIKAVRDEIDILQEHVGIEQVKAQAARTDVLEVLGKLDMINVEIKSLAEAFQEEKQCLKQSDSLPERSKKEADAAVLILKELTAEEEALNIKIKELHNQLESWDQQAKQTLAQQITASKVTDKLQNKIAEEESAADELLKDIEIAKLETEKHLTERVVLSMEMDKRSNENRLQSENLKNEQRTRDVALRRLNQEEQRVKYAQDEIHPLGNAVENIKSQISAQEKELESCKSSREKLQKCVEGFICQLAEEKNLSEVQNTLVKACMLDVHELDKECFDIRSMVFKRDKLAQRAASERDKAGRQASIWVGKLHTVVDLAEARDQEVDELKQKHKVVRAQEKELRSLCGMLGEQMERCLSVCMSAKGCVQGLEKKKRQAEERLQQMHRTTYIKTADLQKAEKDFSAADCSRVQLVNRLAAAKQRQKITHAEVDQAGLDTQRLQQAVEDSEVAFKRLQQNKAAAVAAKDAAQQALLGRGDELRTLYEQSDVCQALTDEGTRALARCDDDIRMLQLEVAELQRKLYSTQKTAPDVVTYDHSIAQLKVEVFKARREAEQLSVTLEEPSLTPDRWRLLPGSIPSREELCDRVDKIDSKLNMRLNQIAQKELTLEELQRLIDSLVQKAAATHDGAFQLSVQMNDCQRGLQGMTRRMMAMISELALYQALSIKYSTDKDALQAQLSSARRNMEQGAAPTNTADQEYARLERDAAQKAEGRQQAAELRRQKEAWLLQQPQSRASPRPHAYLPDTDEGLPKPFLAPFAPFKPSGQLIAAHRPPSDSNTRSMLATPELVMGLNS